MRTVAVLLAAGRSERFGSNKLALRVDGVPIWLKSYTTLYSHPELDGVGIVTSAEMLEECKSLAPGALFVVVGGDSRTQSARQGLEEIAGSADYVLFHDAARPFVTHGLVSRVVRAMLESGAAFPAIPVTDTVKQRAEGGIRTLERSTLMQVQTPQGGKVSDFVKAFSTGHDTTDDMALLESIGVVPIAVDGEPANIKITRPEDFMQRETRTGIGYDVHRFSGDPARPLMLGGVKFEGCEPGLEGHSDADAVLHSVVDALLGAAGLGDIGERFPNTDPRWKDAPSDLFLKDSAAALANGGWSVVNIDVSVLAERPKIGPYKDKIRERIAQVLGMDAGRVAVKATTNEGLGAIGRGEGIASFAVATIERHI